MLHQVGVSFDLCSEKLVARAQIQRVLVFRADHASTLLGKQRPFGEEMKKQMGGSFDDTMGLEEHTAGIL